jgi:hypothetical protein
VSTDVSEENIASIFKVQKNKLSKKHACHLLARWFFAELLTLKMEAIYNPNVGSHSTLHNVLS